MNVPEKYDILTCEREISCLYFFFSGPKHMSERVAVLILWSFEIWKKKRGVPKKKSHMERFELS